MWTDAQGNSIPQVLALHEERPILHHIIEYVSTVGGFTDITIYVAYKKENVKNSVTAAFPAMSLKFLEEDTTHGTASPLFLLRDQGKLPETFIVIYGDNLFMLDFDAMLETHRKKQATVTLALTSVKDPEKYGTVSYLDSTIFAFYEKMSKQDLEFRHIIPPYRVNGGYYVFDKKIFPTIAAFANQHVVSLEKDIFPVLAQRHELAGYCDNGTWIDAGMLECVRDR